MVDILANITYNHNEIFESIEFHTDWNKGFLKLEENENWNRKKEKVIFDHYDSGLGHCVSIDVSPMFGEVVQKSLMKVAILLIKTKPIENMDGNDFYGLQKPILQLINNLS